MGADWFKHGAELGILSHYWLENRNINIRTFRFAQEPCCFAVSKAWLNQNLVTTQLSHTCPELVERIYKAFSDYYPEQSRRTLGW